MATLNTRPSLGVVNEQISVLSITQDGTASTANNTVTVPVGHFWIVKFAAVANPDSTVRANAIQLLDASNAVICTLAGDLVTTGAQGVVTRFAAGPGLPVAAGYSIRSVTTAVGAFVPVLQIYGLDLFTGQPMSVYNLV